MKILLCINEFEISSLNETLAVFILFVEEISVEIELVIAFLGGHVVQSQRYTFTVLQTIQMKLILFSVWAEWAILGSAKTASNSNMKFK